MTAFERQLTALRAKLDRDFATRTATIAKVRHRIPTLFIQQIKDLTAVVLSAMLCPICCGATIVVIEQSYFSLLGERL